MSKITLGNYQVSKKVRATIDHSDVAEAVVKHVRRLWPGLLNWWVELFATETDNDTTEFRLTIHRDRKGHEFIVRSGLLRGEFTTQVLLPEEIR